MLTYETPVCCTESILAMLNSILIYVQVLDKQARTGVMMEPTPHPSEFSADKIAKDSKQRSADSRSVLQAQQQPLQSQQSLQQQQQQQQQQVSVAGVSSSAVQSITRARELLMRLAADLNGASCAATVAMQPEIEVRSLNNLSMTSKRRHILGPIRSLFVSRRRAC